MKYVIKAIDEQKDVRVLMYTFNTNTENRIKKVLALYLKNRGCEMLFSPIYTCIKELLINAIKANYKNIYFENYSHANSGAVDYQTALKLFKLEMTRENERNLLRLARQKDIKAEISFQARGEVLTVRVTNPIPMTSMELDNVKKKLEEAKQCNDISDYFLLHADDPNTEGAGIGLVLISMILRSLGVAQSTLRIRSDEALTSASIAFPLNNMTIEHFEKNTMPA